MSDPVSPLGSPALLDDVLLALQKTFSRLSAVTSERTAPEHREKARALIVGDVNFEMTINVAPTSAAKPAAAVPPDAAAAPQDAPSAPVLNDYLRYCADGSGFPLKLSGRISTDLRLKEPEPARRGRKA
jgi:hypothetical protein